MNSFYKPFVLLLLVFLFSGTLIYANNEKDDIFHIDTISKSITLDKFWKYRNGDSISWAAIHYDDSDWDTINPWLDLNNVSEEQFKGMGWFRLHIRIDSSLRNKTVAYTISQRGASEIYLNGKLIDAHGTIGNADTKEEAFNPRRVPFLIEFQDSINYVLAVRYSSTQARRYFQKYNLDNYGIFSKAGFTLKIWEHKIVVKNLLDSFGRHKFFRAILIVFLIIALLYLLLYLFYRNQRANLFFALLMISISSIFVMALLPMSVSYNPHHLINKLYYWQIGPSLMVPFLSAFLYSFFYRRLPKVFWFIIGLVPVVIILSLLKPWWAEILLDIIHILMLLDVIRIVTIAISKKKKDVWVSIIFLVITFLMIILIVHKNITGRGILQIFDVRDIAMIFFLMFFALALFSIIPAMFIYVAQDFGRTNISLQKQLKNVKKLSAKTIEQEKEKQRILENQKEKLEVMVDERTKELALEKEKTEELLLNTLPLKVVNELKENGKSEPESFDNVTVYFSDIVGFTKISSRLEPHALISELSNMFTVFDDIMTKHQCERIKTIGDAYLAVSGMPIKNEHHAENMMKAANEIKEYIEERNKTAEVQWHIRIGIHSGKVVGGIVGVRKYIYDVFGDTINTASRMESNSEAGRINVSEATYTILKEKFKFIERDNIEVKGKGSMKMYFLDA